MPTSSIYHDVVIDNDEAAERLLEVLEQSEEWAEENAEPQNPRDKSKPGASYWVLPAVLPLVRKTGRTMLRNESSIRGTEMVYYSLFLSCFFVFKASKACMIC